jgi:hypothetical protein
MTQPVVFLGFFLSDPDLAHFMREVVVRIGERAQHFAIMPSEIADERKTQASVTLKLAQRVCENESANIFQALDKV